MSLPGRDEAAPYYFTYIDRIASDDIVSVLTNQLQEVPAFLSQISEEKSLHRYAPEKWSIRQVLNHVNDTERTFAFRALWFGRGFSEPLASFDQNTAEQTIIRGQAMSPTFATFAMRPCPYSRTFRRKHGRAKAWPAETP
jgi:hypothetical protein